MANIDFSKKYICHLGPGSDVPGGMLSVINGYISSEYLSNYLQVHIPTASNNHKIRAFICGYIKLLTMLFKRKAGLLHIHMSERGSCYRSALFIITSKVFGVRTIIHSHGSEIETWYDGLGKLRKKVFNIIFGLSDAVIILTPGWKKFWSEIVDESKLYIIPNGIEVSEAGNKSYYKDGNLNVAFLGYVGERKGAYDLIKAVQFLKSKGRGIVLRIGGNGEIDKCKQMVAELNLQDSIYIMGWLNKDEKEQLLKESDCLALPSKYESFGIVILEAMANQLPVICGDTGYSKEIISNNEDGFVVESGNPRSIADALERLYNKDTLEHMGISGYRNVKNNYDFSVIMGKLVSLYNMLK